MNTESTRSSTRLPGRIAGVILAVVFACFAAAAAATPASAAFEAKLAADVNPGPSSSEADDSVAFRGYLYFTADDGKRGRELWRTRGGRKELVSDINPGVDGSSPNGFTPLGEHLYFRASNEATGSELWRTDGKVTEQVADINPGPDSSSPQPLERLGDNIVFSARRACRRPRALADRRCRHHPDPGHQPRGRFILAAEMTALGDHVYFRADNGLFGAELWRADITSATLVANIEPGGASSNPAGFTEFKGMLYFRATTEPTGNEPTGLDAGDGRAGRRHQPRRHFIDAFASSPSSVTISTSGRPTPRSGTELWRTDGLTPAATTNMATEINPGPDSSNPGKPRGRRQLALLQRRRRCHGSEVWRTNGSRIFRLGDINPGPDGSAPYDFAGLAGKVYFAADDGRRATRSGR